MSEKTIYEQLSAPFPKEALSEDNSRNKGGKGITLTSIKAQWIKERLNKVLGVTGWKIEGKWELGEKGVFYFGHLELRSGTLVPLDLPLNLL